VATSKVFDEMWARKVLDEDEAAQRLKYSAHGGASVYALVQLLPLKDHNKLILYLEASYIFCVQAHKYLKR
jgi:hypothetical protein